MCHVKWNSAFIIFLIFFFLLPFAFFCFKTGMRPTRNIKYMFNKRNIDIGVIFMLLGYFITVNYQQAKYLFFPLCQKSVEESYLCPILSPKRKKTTTIIVTKLAAIYCYVELIQGVFGCSCDHQEAIQISSSLRGRACGFHALDQPCLPNF